MCGIVGFQNFKKVNFDCEKKLREITKTLNHRGPDFCGFWKSSNGNTFFGHTRLSIIDLSTNGSQPMVSINGRYVIVFNGEIYNYKLIKKDLKKKFNVKFNNETDTSVLLESISFLGLRKTLKLIEGMFAFALFDKKDESITLVRDRYGEKPLFYFFDENNFIFSSELKAIKKFFEKQKLEIDSESCKLFSCLGYIPAPLTIFKKTYKVLPAQIIKIKEKKIIEKEKYWGLDNIKNSSIEIYDYENINNLIEKSVKKLMIADVEIGCFLSGGIDSSLVASLMQKNSMKKIKTFTIGFKEKQFDESQYAKEIANHLGTDHHEMIISIDDMMENIENVYDIYDEPFGDSSFLPTNIVSKLASKSVKVVLSGDGGDEVFLGYNRYLFAKKIQRFNNYIPLGIRKILKSLLTNFPIGILDYMSKPFEKKLGIQGFSHKIQKIANLMEYNDHIDFYKKLNLIDNKNLEFLTNYKIFDEDRDLISSTQLNDINYYLPNDILTKVDRASMNNSLEVRSPFLDSTIAKYIFKISNKYKMKNGTLKYFLKKSLNDFVPKKYFDRPKMGFAIPLDIWLKKKKIIKLFDDIYNTTDWEQISMDSTSIKKIWSGYKNYKNHTPTTVWNYAMAGIWLKRN